MQDGGVTTDNKGQVAETFDTVSDAHGQLFMQVSCAALQNSMHQVVNNYAREITVTIFRN